MPSCLQDFVAANLICRQVSATKTVSVDTDDVSGVEDIPTGLRSVSNDNSLATVMGFRKWQRQVCPVGGHIFLHVHRLRGVVTSMHEDRVGDLVIGNQVLIKLKMTRGDLVE